MTELLIRAYQDLLGRITGPMAFRLILQPTVAIFLAVRAGLRDAREGRPAYAWAIVTHAGHRLGYVRDGWKDIAKVFIVAVVMDVVYQVVELRWIYPGQSLIVATALAILPYLLVRGPISRMVRQYRWSRTDS